MVAVDADSSPLRALRGENSERPSSRGSEILETACLRPDETSSEPLLAKGEISGGRIATAVSGKGFPRICFYRAAGIYSDFALKRVARRVGASHFFVGRLECNVNRLGRESLGWI